MALKSLNRFLALRTAVIRARNRWISWRKGVRFEGYANASLSSAWGPSRPGAIVVGPDTLVAFNTLIYSYDARSGEDRPVRIGARCFIGGGSIVTPGSTIGDECIVGAGAVVFGEVPARSIVVGNPARVFRREIEVGPFGRLKAADERARLTHNPTF